MVLRLALYYSLLEREGIMFSSDCLEIRVNDDYTVLTECFKHLLRSVGSMPPFKEGSCLERLFEQAHSKKHPAYLLPSSCSKRIVNETLFYFMRMRFEHDLEPCYCLSLTLERADFEHYRRIQNELRFRNICLTTYSERRPGDLIRIQSKLFCWEKIDRGNIKQVRESLLSS